MSKIYITLIISLMLINQTQQQEGDITLVGIEELKNCQTNAFIVDSELQEELFSTYTEKIYESQFDSCANYLKYYQEDLQEHENYVTLATLQDFQYCQQDVLEYVEEEYAGLGDKIREVFNCVQEILDYYSDDNGGVGEFAQVESSQGDGAFFGEIQDDCEEYKCYYQLQKCHEHCLKFYCGRNQCFFSENDGELYLQLAGQVDECQEFQNNLVNPELQSQIVDYQEILNIATCTIELSDMDHSGLANKTFQCISNCAKKAYIQNKGTDDQESDIQFLE